MDCMKIQLISGDNCTLAVSRSSGDGVSLLHNALYQQGDRLVIDVAQEGLYLLRLDEALPETAVWLHAGACIFPIPWDSDRICYSPKAFSGNCHLVTARPVANSEPATKRNLALNPYDHHTTQGIFPHATANVETRGEAVFAARNAIDGIYENCSHGEYPYSSWGINRDPDAALKVDFGRTVLVDELRITLRADFPHDSWWRQVTVTFSDGGSEVITLQKTHLPQTVIIAPHTIQWLCVGKLIKADDPSPFPALTQLEVWGTSKQ